MRKPYGKTKTLMFVGGFFLAAALAGGPASAASGPLSPAQLRCEYLKDPLGIDVRQPRFAWVDEHSERGQKQSAYQVLVSSSPERLNQDEGDQWDSGRAASENSTQVVYSGKPLESGRRYYWKVRYWDKDGNASPYSRPSFFEMGLLAAAEWKGQWIGGANELRSEFRLNDSVTRARAYICGLGYYELRLNGAKVGSNVLDPAWTTFDKRVLYTTYDVTRYLHKGANAVGVMLGQGWYGSRALLLHMNIELASGEHFSVVSSSAWKTKQGPITSDGVWDGETYDARLETPGWDEPSFDDSGWSPAQAVKAPGGLLSAQMMPPIRVVDTIVPVALTNPRPGVYVFDLGQNFSGWARLRASGPAGTAVQMRFSELVYPDGRINRENIGEAKARDIYTLRGEGLETYQPRFTYHGFRYVEVTGFPGTPNLDSLRGRVVHTAVNGTGSFAASNPLLNQIHKIVRWSELSNLFGVPTDCDQRNERMGWLGDAQTSAEAMMLNFDMAAFYTNFVRDMRDVQGEDGTITDTVPHKYGQRPADPAWGTAYPLIVWYMYEQYGDRRILEDNFESLKKYVDFLSSRAPDHVLRYSYYGDWVAIEPTPGALVSDFYYYYDAQIVAQIAKILSNSADASRYGQLAAEIKEAFNREFFDPKTGNYAGGTQTANSLPLFLGLATEKQSGSASRNLENDIIYGHDTHVTTGFIGVKYLLPVLTRLGRSDLAYELAAQTTYPSWGYMIAHGATTLWEIWQEKAGPGMNSHNHHMLGSVDSWFYQALGGISPEPSAPGYLHFEIAPKMVRDLQTASVTVDTVRGRISSSWNHGPDGVALEVEVPVNSTASVAIPKNEEMTEVTVREGDQLVWDKGHYVAGAPGVTGATVHDGTITFEVGSGRYAFRLTGQ